MKHIQLMFEAFRYWEMQGRAEEDGRWWWKITINNV